MDNFLVHPWIDQSQTFSFLPLLSHDASYHMINYGDTTALSFVWI